MDLQIELIDTIRPQIGRTIHLTSATKPERTYLRVGEVVDVVKVGELMPVSKQCLHHHDA